MPSFVGRSLTVAALTLIAVTVHAQAPSPVKPMAPDAKPSFAVATIKLHNPNSNHQGFDAAGDRFMIRNQTVLSLMLFAYALEKHQVLNAPAWAQTDRFDIEGKTDPPGQPNLHQQQELLQTLLAERFALKIHHETRELPVYAIEIAKGGSKLKPAANPDAEADQTASNHGGNVTISFTSASMADFILGMQFFLDRPLVDQTGIPGRHDFALRYTREDTNATDPGGAPGLFTAIQEQLGLKLHAVKAPIDTITIDSVTVPTPD
jgi:uncharacterized protein (TIGR03435 family)